MIIHGFDPTLPPKPSPTPVALYVPYKGRAEMCGRVMRVDQWWVCYHESNGTQFHRKTDSIGGVDVAVLDWLDQHGVELFHHDFQPKDPAKALAPRGLYMTTVQALRAAPRFNWDNRDRHFLATAEWRYLPSCPYVPQKQLPRLTL